MCECNCKPKLSAEEYERRALPRLAAIDALSPRCKWGEWAPGWEAMQAREQWKRLMDAQAADEVAAGL